MITFFRNQRLHNRGFVIFRSFCTYFKYFLSFYYNNDNKNASLSYIFYLDTFLHFRGRARLGKKLRHMFLYCKKYGNFPIGFGCCRVFLSILKYFRVGKINYKGPFFSSPFPTSTSYFSFLFNSFLSLSYILSSMFVFYQCSIMSHFKIEEERNK
jgi:hypothetical protein